MNDLLTDAELAEARRQMNAIAEGIVMVANEFIDQAVESWGIEEHSDIDGIRELEYERIMNGRVLFPVEEYLSLTGDLEKS